jgi:hypothetical protein
MGRNAMDQGPRDYAARMMYGFAAHHTEGAAAGSRSYRARRTAWSPRLWWRRWAVRRLASEPLQ